MWPHTCCLDRNGPNIPIRASLGFSRNNCRAHLTGKNGWMPLTTKFPGAVERTQCRGVRSLISDFISSAGLSALPAYRCCGGFLSPRAAVGRGVYTGHVCLESWRAVPRQFKGTGVRSLCDGTIGALVLWQLSSIGYCLRRSVMNAE